MELVQTTLTAALKDKVYEMRMIADEIDGLIEQLEIQNAAMRLKIKEMKEPKNDSKAKEEWDEQVGKYERPN